MLQEKNKTKINTTFSLVALVASALSSFFLVPLITHFMSVEAYGYIGLSLTFVTLGQVLSVAITAMSTRYIVVAINQGEKERANVLFNSVLAACFVCAFCVVIIFSMLSLVIADVAVITSEYISQVKVMLLAMATSLAINVLSTPFIAAQHYTNNLIPYYVMTSLSQGARIIVTFFLFLFFEPAIYVPYVSALIVDIASVGVFFCYFRQHMPMLSINLKLIEIVEVKEVVISGIWVAINRAGTILLTTFSIYICNLQISPYAAGLYSSFAQLQTLFLSLANSLISSFVPTLLGHYGKGNLNEFFASINKELRFVSLCVGIGVAVAILFSLPFFKLWLNTSVDDYYVVVVVMLLTAGLSYPFEILNQGLIVQNQVKASALITLILGLLNIALSIVLINCFNLGLLAVAIAQFATSIVRAWLVFPICLCKGFAGQIQRMYMSSLMTVLVLLTWTIILIPLNNLVYSINDWFVLIGAILLVASCGYVLTFVLLRKQLSNTFS